MATLVIHGTDRFSAVPLMAALAPIFMMENKGGKPMAALTARESMPLPVQSGCDFSSSVVAVVLDVGRSGASIGEAWMGLRRMR